MHRLLAVVAAGTMGVVVSSAVGGASAQPTEFRLDEDGEWVLESSPEEGTDEAVIAAARRELAADQPERALSRINAWLTLNEDAPDALLSQALLVRGDARTASGNEWKALYDYERIIKEFASTGEYVTAIERELEIAVRYVNGLRRKIFGVRIFDAEPAGEELLIRVQERLPGSRVAERAGIELANYYYRNRELELAEEAYELFIENYPRSAYVPDAMERRVYATIARYRGPRYDGSALVDAQVLIERLRSLYPERASQSGLDDALLARLEESAAAELWATADWYLRTGDEVGARYILERLVREHPRTGVAVDAIKFLESKGWIGESLDDALPADLMGEDGAGDDGAGEEGSE